MNELIHKCPQCGRLLSVDETGTVGRCPHHKKWYSVVAGSEALASRKNAEEKQAEKERLREEEEARRQEQLLRVKMRRRASMRMLFIALVVVLAVAAVVVLFVVRPAVTYEHANTMLSTGEYTTARDTYLSLNDYKDSTSRATLCEAFLDIQQGNVANAIEKLDMLTADESTSSIAMLSNALLPIMNQWNTSGLAPEAMLLLLQRRDQIDANHTLDYERLSYEAHAALLDSNVRLSAALDIDGDGANELVALLDDYSLYAYEMEPTGNARITVDGNTSATCLLSFGDDMLNDSVEEALACYLQAYRLVQTDQTKGKVALGYRTQAIQKEAAGDISAALADAKLALNTSAAEEDFTFLYDMMLRSCRDEKDQQLGIEHWNEFLKEQAAYIQKFNAVQKANTDAGQLCLAYAMLMAQQHDDACIAQFEQARSYGVNIEQQLQDAIVLQAPGLLAAKLRLLAVGLYEQGSAQQLEQKSLLTAEVVAAISNWSANGLDGNEALQLILFADDNAISLDEMNRNAVFESAALAAANAQQVSQKLFVDWDGDGYQELIFVGQDGVLHYELLRDRWMSAASFPSELEAPTLTLVEADKPLLLLVSAKQDGLVVVAYENGKLTFVLREDGLTNLVANGNTLTFDRVLSGSLTRCEHYSFELASASPHPVRTGIDWQQEHYPYPTTAEQVLRRWLEAYTYSIAPEQALLVSDSSASGSEFSLAALQALPVPDNTDDIQLSAYDVQTDMTLYEATYPSGGSQSRVYMAVEQQGDAWKVAGASDRFSPDVADGNADMSVALLALNQETTNTLAKKDAIDNYRVLLTQTSQVALLWQAGDSNKSRTAFVVTIYDSKDMTQPVISYELALSTSKQLSYPLFLTPGVYYVSVTAKSDLAVPYHITLQATHDPYVESEENDTATHANVLTLNRSYTASLKDNKDIDFFSFTLQQPGRVALKIEAEDDDRRLAKYQAGLYSAATGEALTSLQMPGNVETTQSANLYLAAGQYFVSVARGSYHSAGAYHLEVQYEQRADIEQESNKTQATATPISVNQDVHGSFGIEKDEDFFTFTLANDSVIQPRLSFEPLESATRTYVLAVLNNTQTMLTASIGGKESQKVIVPLALKAGTYTVKLTNPNFTPQDYTLFIAAVDADIAEAEPNDALAQATALSLASPVTGVLSHEEDEDLYKITLPQEITATLRFSFPPSVVETNVYMVRLEQNGKSLWSTSVKGSTGGFEQQLQIPAGEYYIRIKASGWISAVYTIELE